MSRKRQATPELNQEESKKSVFSGFYRFNRTQPSSFDFLSTNGTTSSAFASFSPETDETEDPKAKYYSKLKGLNVSVSDWIKQHVDKTPLCILSPVFKDYEKHLKEIKEEYGAPPQRSPSFQEQQHVPRTETPTEPQQRHATPPPQAHQPSPPPQQAPQPQQQAPSANDPIFRILNVQTDVLDIMTEVENFTGTKKDKRYIYLDEMLIRNLIKLDDLETDDNENIRQARKGAIKCIQKCIAALEAKAEQQHVPRTETPTEPQQRHATPPPQAHQPSPPPQQAPQPQQQAPSANDPIFRILNVQTDVLDIMTELENFTGTKKDKRYIYLDEMLTRNLIKLDDIETDGQENIRQARKGAIKCIQKCIAALEAKAEQQHVPRTETPTEPQQRHATPPPQAHQPSPPPQQAPQPQQQAPSANDPIFRILNVQTDVLDIMTEVENFTGTKKDKRYIYLDEMLTRNLIKLDDIETDGQENIRQARKGAIKCIQKCIAALEAKAVSMGVSMC